MNVSLKNLSSLRLNFEQLLKLLWTYTDVIDSMQKK